MIKKKGFTLIELLAVIAILAIIVVIAVTKIGTVIEDAKRESFKSTNKIIANQIGKLNGVEIVPQTYTFTNGVSNPDIQLNGELPTSGTVEINQNGEIQLATSNAKFCAIKRFNESEVAVFNVGDRLCNIIVEITLTINPNEGIFEGSTSNTTYQVEPEADKEIPNPARTNYSFDGWALTGGGSLNNTTFTADLEDATLTANWVINPTLTLNLNSGTTTQTFNERYVSNTEISLLNPTRNGYVFNNWTVSGTGSSITGTTLRIGTGNATLTANWLSYASMYTYTGSSTVIDDGTGNWRIKFLTSGTFTPLVSLDIDAFLVGGGGGGGTYPTSAHGGAGGGGGYTGTYTNISLSRNVSYNITVGGGGGPGSAGGATSIIGTAVNYSKNGGASGGESQYQASGGAGGSGGGEGATWGYAGGSNGSNGSGTYFGAGQGSTTREFAEATGTLYSGGGGGGCWDHAAGAGGAGGGGNGAQNNTSATAGVTNTGGGGGGRAGYGLASSGGSGIAVIRNARFIQVGNSVKYRFSYSGAVDIIDGNTDNWKIKFLSSGTYVPLSNMVVDAFLVGGGGGGGTYPSSAHGGAGGGGGYTGTYMDITLSMNTAYNITIGAGGVAGSTGGTTSIIGTGVNYSKTGGASGGESQYTATGGNGGSGGGEGATWGNAGGSNGSNGYGTYFGTGQGSTTREFAEAGGTLYAGGGGGGSWDHTAGAGGAGGGGAGSQNNVPATPGTPNTGGGGGGRSGSIAAGGGSGIIVIRKS